MSYLTRPSTLLHGTPWASRQAGEHGRLQTPTPVISHPGAQLTRVRVRVLAAGGPPPPPCLSPVGDLPSSSPTHASPCFPQKRIDHLQIQLHSWILTLFQSVSRRCPCTVTTTTNNTTITDYPPPFYPFAIIALTNYPSEQTHGARSYAHGSW